MDLTSLKGITVPIIIIAVYSVVSILKQVNKSEKFLTFIPIISAVLGAVLGVLLFFAMPEEMAISHNVASAIMVGGASGLAATGTNQILKQMDKKDNSDKTQE